MRKFKIGEEVVFIKKGHILFNSEGTILNIEYDYMCGQEIPNGIVIVNFHYFFGRQCVSVYDLILKKLKVFL